jgi:hypothetical protein
VDKSQDIVACFLNDTLVLSAQKPNKGMEIDQQLVIDLLWLLAIWLVLLQISRFVEDLVHDLQKVVGAPLLVRIHH